LPNTHPPVGAMRPFDSYPGGGNELLGRVVGGNCRRGYGLRFVQKTGQTACAYCGMDLVGSYQSWLQMALDHVVPKSVCKNFSLPDDWVEDYTNKVVTCAACNGFDNRYKPPGDAECPQSLQAFYRLRDRIFAERIARIAECHKTERQLFERRPWEQHS
jgi:hypothetical protein